MMSLNNNEREKIDAMFKKNKGRFNPRILEKDILVTKVIAAVSEKSNAVEGIEPIFCGGTCLSKAYGIISRMSEDVDFKIRDIQEMSNSQARKRHKEFKYNIFEHLENIGFTDIKCKAFFGNAFFVFEIPYESLYRSDVDNISFGTLRPFIKAEFIVRPLYLPTVKREISSMVDTFLGIEGASFSTHCQ